MITSDLQSPVPPDEVLAVLCLLVAEWRESQLPESLRRRGVLAVTAEIHGRTCIVAYDWPGRGPDHPMLPLRLEAAVRDSADGGSVIRIRCYYQSRLRLAAVLSVFAAIVPVVVLGADAWPSAILAMTLFGGFALFERDTLRGPTRRADPEADYLVQRVEAAVAHIAAVRRF